MVTIEVALLWNPSFTINSAVYVPILSAKKVGETTFAALRVDLLPGGWEVNVQKYVSVVPALLVEPLPLRTTVESLVTN